VGQPERAKILKKRRDSGSMFHNGACVYKWRTPIPSKPQLGRAHQTRLIRAPAKPRCFSSEQYRGACEHGASQKIERDREVALAREMKSIAASCRGVLEHGLSSLFPAIEHSTVRVRVIARGRAGRILS
jgi:hypothetical protein